MKGIPINEIDGMENKNVIDSRDSATIRFGYYLKDCFKADYNYSVEVVQDDDGFHVLLRDTVTDTEEVVTIISLSDEVGKQIEDAYSDNQAVFEVDAVEQPPVFDGVYNRFLFSDYPFFNDITAGNIWYYRDNSKAVNAQKVLKLFWRMKDILMSAGVDEKYFKLS